MKQETIKNVKLNELPIIDNDVAYDEEKEMFYLLKDSKPIISVPFELVMGMADIVVEVIENKNPNEKSIN